MRIIQQRPYFRFEFTYARSASIGRCLVEIYATGVDPTVQADPVIVLTQRKSDPSSPGITNAVEYICTQLRSSILWHLRIDPVRVTWLLYHEGSGRLKDEWQRVTFSAASEEVHFFAAGVSLSVPVQEAAQASEQHVLVHPDYDNPNWHPHPPIVFEWNTLPATSRWVNERQVVDLRDFQLEPFGFTDGECHRARTGQCSLELPDAKDKHIGAAGFDYCRRLAVLAQVWSLATEVSGGDVPQHNGAASTTPEMIEYIQQNYLPVFGHMERETGHEVAKAVMLFGAVDPGQGIQVALTDDIVEFTDGRHRTCVSCRLGIPVGITLSRETE